MEKTILFRERVLSPKLFVLYHGKSKQFVIRDKMLLGRNTKGHMVDISLDANFVSRNHGEVGADAVGIYYMDTNSTNGTYLNRKKLPTMEKKYLSDGDVLHILNEKEDGKPEFVVLIYSTNYPQNFSWEFLSFHKDTAEINIGRKGQKGISLEDEAVSMRHASFFLAREGWAIVDHQSTNGVFVNNQRLIQPQYLRVGDCIRIANRYLVFWGNGIVFQKVEFKELEKKRAEVLEKEEIEDIPLEIHIAERSVWQRAKKIMLLQNINLTIHSGEMVLILGGSGAGKTTFMNAVMGYEKAKGQIKHGEVNIYEEFESMKYKIGFVPQQDLLRGGDTVYDTLKNAAELKLPTSVKKDEREKRIQQVLDNLGLRREKDSLVSKLSGGQRKRLSIAVEYVADPSLFFLDEPDSGLDGIMAKSLMRNLRDIADEGKIVMVISHAPDRTADLFDKVVVLAKSAKDNCGHLAFFGTVDEAYCFFETNSLEGVVRRINRLDEGGEEGADYYIEKYNKEQ